MARIKPQALLQQSKKKKGPSRMSVTTIAIYGLIIVAMVFFLFSTYKHWTRRSEFQMKDISGAEKEKSFDAMEKVDVPKYAVIKTSKGSIIVELYKEGSPEVVGEFIESCQKGRFKGMLFNRVIKNFIIQGGDVNRPGNMEDWTLKGKHYNHIDSRMNHEAFMLGTSKAKPDGGGFDLVITTSPIPDLNEKINVFGHVVKGEDVVQEIEEADTDDHYQPKTPIGIIEVTLKQKI
ncbi:hypothetical protein ACJIZ3_011546 [Penstemon smallii]|uniref:Peptidyl-prolyl cis-trans isomerase n=1 Tax=Penstemon smallii TaxID=265156 RepID=A0ABD3UJF5_9LAMI